MYILFYDTQFNLTDEIEAIDVQSYTRDNIEYEEGRLNNVSSLFIVSEDKNVTQENLIAFYAPLVIKELAKENEEIILNGFHSPSLDAQFSFDYKDQQNMGNELTLMSNGLSDDIIKWNSIDKGVMNLTQQQFKDFCVDAKEHKRMNIERYWYVKYKVLECDSLETLQQIKTMDDASEAFEYEQAKKDGTLLDITIQLGKK